MKVKKNYIFLILCFIIINLFSIIDYSNKNSKDNLINLKVSEVTHSVFYAPQYIAKNLGFFKDEGLNVEIINSQGADKVMTAVLSNQVDIGFAGPEAAIYVYNEGEKDFAQIFAQVTQKDGSFLVSRENIKNFNWQNIKNKHILPGRKGGVPYMTLQYIIEKNGLNIDKDLNFDNSISFDTMNTAFASGIGDFVTIFEPTATIFEKEGKGHIVASLGEESGRIPYTAYFAKKSFINNNNDTIQKFVNAIYKAQKWIHSHSESEIANVISPSFPEVDKDILEKVVLRYKNIDAWNTTPLLDKESFNKLQEIIINAGELKSKAPFENIVNNSFSKNIKN